MRTLASSSSTTAAQEGYSTEYLHWVASYVAVGDYVRAGEPIGEVGNVGFSTDRTCISRSSTSPLANTSILSAGCRLTISLVPIRAAYRVQRCDCLPARLPVSPKRQIKIRRRFQPKSKCRSSSPQDEAASADAKRHHRHGDATTDGQANSASSGHGEKKRGNNGDATT